MARLTMLTDKQFRRLCEQTRIEPSGCVLWTGAVHKRGYGVYLHERVHRVWYEYYNGSIPEGTELAHSCNIKLCLVHARPKTHLGNLQEYSGKTRNEVCKRGHEMTEDNIYVPPGKSWNRCRKCNRIDQRIAYWRKKGLSEEEAMARSSLGA